MDDDPSEPAPAPHPGPDVRSGPVQRTLEVDGEVFALRRTEDGVTHYDWVSGPNETYGFSSSGPEQSEDGHRQSIRSFLDMIDPATGYIAED